jgi:hypothetical protein
MTRRSFLSLAAAAPAAKTGTPVELPIQHVLDTASKPANNDLSRFRFDIWPEAVRDFSRCGVKLQMKASDGEIRRSPGGNPIFKGLVPNAINLVLTPQVPMAWDQGRALAGLTTRYERYHVCVIALRHAHPHQVPLLSVNTCVHELLHVLFEDIYEPPKKRHAVEIRELRIDLYATRLWLFREGAAIRKAADAYAQRIRSATATSPHAAPLPSTAVGTASRSPAPEYPAPLKPE